MQASKPFWQSKTVWLNVVLTLIGIATFLAVPKNDPSLSVASIAAAAAGVLNVVLRIWFTDQPISAG
jgi:hypothetical protein